MTIPGIEEAAGDDTQFSHSKCINQHFFYFKIKHTYINAPGDALQRLQYLLIHYTQ
jgi:hypothetical protein